MKFYINSTIVLIAAAFAAAFFFQIEWLFYLAIALTAIILITNKPASVQHKEEKEQKQAKKLKRRVVIVRERMHHQPSDIIQEKIQEELKEVPILKPYTHIHENWDKKAGRGGHH